MSAQRTSLRHGQLLLALPLLACASTHATPAGTSQGGAAQALRRWPAEADPRVTKLVAAAGDDVLALAMIHPDVWSGARRLLGQVDAQGELDRQLPWLGAADVWGPLQGVLGLLPPRTAPTSGELAGWDRSRPVAVAVVDAGPRGPLAALCARLFAPEAWPVRLRLLVPASDATVLARALDETLARLHQGPPLPGRYLIESHLSEGLAIAIVPSDDHVRMELLYLPHVDRRLRKAEKALRALLDPVAQPLRERTMHASDPITRLLASGRGLTISLRPNELAQWFLLGGPERMRDALAHVEPSIRAPLLSMGLGDILTGYLVTSAGQPEVAELALALEIDSAIRIASLTRLTEAGRRQMSGSVGKTATPIATSPGALAGLALATSASASAGDGEPLFGPTLPVQSAEEMLQHAQVSGQAGWWALLARPAALWRTLLADKKLAGSVGGRAVAPADVAFELFDVDADGKPTFRMRGRLPQDEPGAARWVELVGRLVREAGDSRVMALKAEHRLEGTWVTWTVSMAGPLPVALPVGRARLPPGTFFAGRARPAAIAERTDRDEPVDYRNEAAFLLRPLLRQLVYLEASLRWQSGWLVGQASVALAGQPAPEGFVADLRVEGPNTREPPPGKALPVLHRAVAAARELLTALANVAPAERMSLLAHGRSQLEGDLGLVRQDPVLRAEAAALDHMLFQVRRAFEQAEATAGQQPSPPDSMIPDDRFPALVPAPPAQPQPRPSNQPKSKPGKPAID